MEEGVGSFIENWSNICSRLGCSTAPDFKLSFVTRMSFLLFAVAITPGPFLPISSEQGKALCQAAARPTFPAAARTGKHLQELQPKANIAGPHSAPSSHRHTLNLQVPLLKPVFLQNPSSKGKEKSRGRL